MHAASFFVRINMVQQITEDLWLTDDLWIITKNRQLISNKISVFGTRFL